MNKQCQKCKTTKLLTEFHNNKRSPDRKNGRCKECRKIVTPEERERTNKRRRETMKDQKYVLKKLFGWTMDDYNTLLSVQNGCCAICERHHTEFKTRMPLDHNHETNSPRGILCHVCNWALGVFKDNIELLQNAKNYIEFYEVQNEQTM